LTKMDMEQIKGYTKISDIFKNITPEGQFISDKSTIIPNTEEIKKGSLIGVIYEKKAKQIEKECAAAEKCATETMQTIEQTKNELRYYYLLILNYVNRIYEGYKINQTLEILQLITKKKRKPKLVIGYKPGLSLLELFCNEYLSPKGDKSLPYYLDEEPFLEIKDASETILLQNIFDGEEMGILTLDIREEHEEEKLMKETNYDELIKNKIFRHLNNYDMMTAVRQESIFFSDAIVEIAKLVDASFRIESSQVDILTRSSIEYIYTFATGLIKPYFVVDSNKNIWDKNMKEYKGYKEVTGHWYREPLRVRAARGVEGGGAEKERRIAEREKKKRAEMGVMAAIGHDKMKGGNKIINQNIRVKELNKLKKLYKKLNKK